MQLSQRMSMLGTETAFDVLARAKRLEAEGHDIINLGIGAPDFRTPDNIVEAGIKALRDGYHFYTPAKGLPDLRQAVAEDVLKYRGATIDPDNVLIVPGGKPTMFFAMLMFGEPGAEILYPNPGFPIYESMIRFSGATPVPIELLEEKGFTFDADAVLAKINRNTRLIIVNTPANPTGGLVPRAELEKLVKGLEAHPHVAILSDEIYSRMTYDGEEHVSLLEFDSIRDRLIVLDGWSKTFSMTGWRLGWGLWPASLIAQAERLQINSTSCPSAPVQVAAIEALRGPQTAVDTMMAAFDERRKVIVEGLNALPGFSCVMPKGAFYTFPNITGTGMKSQELETLLLRKAGVAVLSGTSFGHLGEGYLRFSYASSKENIERALERVASVLQPA
ncbi:Putative N-acetyl-LL-diaminopimelate aminotransferase [Planctomycetes bacterium Pla86]|uniref:N-acetyl-LL-diaminopimelate aminotransferase n=2 Tax=Engelhardtia mirabilis TaxID=2528011 RepID=A0A518BLP7_9BACT|nr:Putative N-acetyl-LL-diaminopimelate aminotransferase [Planctomycetes bacterium Pla133]QDV02216.1 Putative N-acetyl-LL-diaminopimelate aminotransferase [Planctomycetes bacterium Pla86]